MCHLLTAYPPETVPPLQVSPNWGSERVVPAWQLMVNSNDLTCMDYYTEIHIKIGLFVSNCFEYFKIHTTRTMTYFQIMQLPCNASGSAPTKRLQAVPFAELNCDGHGTCMWMPEHCRANEYWSCVIWHHTCLGLASNGSSIDHCMTQMHTAVETLRIRPYA